MAFNTKTAGKVAGKLSSDGYVQIGLRVNGKAISMVAHRIVWALHHGSWPTMQIDHINRIRNDNRIENLRDVTPAENSRNSARNRVCPYVGPHYHGRFQAQVKIGDENIHIGIFDTEQEAHEHRAMVNAEMEKVARALAKRMPRPATNRRRDHQTFPRQTPIGAIGDRKESHDPQE
jgi:hypothetical protein